MTKELPPADQAALNALDQGIAALRQMIDQLIAEYKEEVRLMKERQKRALAAARSDLKRHEKMRSILTGEKLQRKPRKPREVKEVAA